MKIPITYTKEREQQIFSYDHLTKHNMWEVENEMKAEREVATELLKALKDVLEDSLAPVNTLAMLRAEAIIWKAEGVDPATGAATEEQELAGGETK